VSYGHRSVADDPDLGAFLVNRRTLARARFARTSAEGGGGGTENQQTGTGENQQQQNTGPEMAKDDAGNELYPLNTATKDMKPEHLANYWRAESKKQQHLREEAERKLQGQNNGSSGTVPNQQQTQGAQSDDAAVQARIDEARREGQRDAVVVSLTASLQMRGKTTDEITEILDVIDPGKFLDTNGKVDTTKVANHLARVAPAPSSNGGGGAPGQGRQGEHNQRTDPREIAREEAKRRGHLDPGANRGALGGLRK
jgi:hypothetical protein